MVNPSQSAEGHQVLVLCTEEMAEVSSGSQMLAALHWKTLPAAERLTWSHCGSGRMVHFVFSCLVKMLLYNCQHPKASGCPLGDRGGWNILASAY